MRFRIPFALALLLAIVAVSARPMAGHAQENAARPELDATYTYMHSNAPPGGCGCFSLNGGSVAYAWPLKPGRFALVGDITADHAGRIGTAGYTLTLSTFTVGGRYFLPMKDSLWQPFGQALIGVAHSSGTLTQPPNLAAANAGAAFAANLGGGIDLRPKGRFAFRLVEADYIVTTFDNASNNHQNNLRISVGVVFRF